jgi:hypothetical protein
MNRTHCGFSAASAVKIFGGESPGRDPGLRRTGEYSGANFKITFDQSMATVACGASSGNRFRTRLSETVSSCWQKFLSRLNRGCFHTKQLGS